MSVQGHANVQIIKNATDAVAGLKASETSTCSDRSLVSDKLVNQPLHETSTLPRNQFSHESGTFACDTKAFRWTLSQNHDPENEH